MKTDKEILAEVASMDNAALVAGVRSMLATKVSEETPDNGDERLALARFFEMVCRMAERLLITPTQP